MSDRRKHCRRDLVGALDDRCGVAGRETVGGEGACQLGEVEGVAAALPEEGAPAAFRDLVAEQLLRLLLVQRGQAQLCHGALAGARRNGALEDGGRGPVPIRDQGEDRGPESVAKYVGKQLERTAIRPMEVVEGEHEGPLFRE